MADTPRMPIPAAQAALQWAEMIYPVVMSLAFIIAAAGWSVYKSRSAGEINGTAPRGPGGHLLPSRRRTGNDPDEEEPSMSPLARRMFRYTTALAALTFIANGGVIVFHTMHDHVVGGDGQRWWCDQSRLVYIIGAGFVYLYYVITLYEWADSPAPAHAFIWTLSLIGEAIILVLSILTVTGPRWVLQDVRTSKYARHTRADGWDQVDLGIATLRLVLVAGLVLSYAALAWKRQRKVHGHYVGHEARTAFNRNEATPLLGNEGPDYLTQNRDEHENQHPVDSEVSSMDGVSERDLKVVEADGDGFYRPKKLPVKSWWEYCRDYAIFFPYLWPSTVPRLQGAVLICFVLLLLQRVVNLLVPFQIGIVTDSLESGEEPRHMPWAALSLLVVYKLLQGPSGALGSLRTILWIPVSQHTYRALITAAFQHVHSLSLDFHLKKRTGEIQSALNKGGAINQFLEQVTFQVFPMILDLLIAIVFFYVNFNAMYALFVSIITFFYLHLTIRMAATRAQQRREMTNADRDEEAIKNESIQSYETIKYFNAEQFEFDKYGAAIDKFQTAEAQVILGTSHMNVCQALVFLLGILVAMLLGAYEVTMGKRTVGDFVLLITYLQQLQGPLNYFGSFYRTVQQAMISGERLLELFKYQPSVIDEPGACALVNPEGYVRFENVGFYYDERKPALHDLSFDCKPGTTTAFVGESGGGKSTIFRLMFRYYNPTEGRLEIDGKDVRGLTIDSVRRAIGVVPQDTTLFNETIMYNLRYAKPDATDDEVFDACRAAAIHDRIMHFPDGYKTIVGERGLRLSGGEKQRVAIARTILKNPKIIMLDEATSALDGETESEIHARMNSGNWGKDRTLLIIAHRLSTITHAEQIIVLHAGGVAEKGTHEELLALKGKYASMWDKHVRAERAVSKAQLAHKKARKLLRQANIQDRKACEGDRTGGFSATTSSAFHQSGISTPRDVSDESHNNSDSLSNASTSDGESSKAASRRQSQDTRPSDGRLAPQR